MSRVTDINHNFSLAQILKRTGITEILFLFYRFKNTDILHVSAALHEWTASSSLNVGSLFFAQTVLLDGLFSIFKNKMSI